MPADTVPSDVTAVIAPHIPVLTSGAQAISAAREFAASLVEVIRTIAAVDPAILVLPPNHGQI
jgi:hypothetical protein